MDKRDEKENMDNVKALAETQRSRSNGQSDHLSERQSSSIKDSISQGLLFSDDKIDFINENDEFTAKLKLYDDEEGEASLAYHGLAGEVVRTIDPHTEADPVATLITFLVFFGNIIGDNAHFMATARKHPARIFAVVVGESGKGRKGASLGPIQLLFRAIDPAWVQNGIKEGLSSGEGLIEAVRDEETRTVPITEGKGKNKEIVGYETEIIAEGVTDKRVVILEEEFGRVLRTAKREGNTLSAIIRQLFDTGSVSVLTRTPLKATGAHVSILGQITPDELRKEIKYVDLVNGMANRFLWIMVERSKLLPSGGYFHKLNLEPLVKKIKEVIEFGKETGELVRDPEADKFWEEIYEPLSTGVTGIVGSVTSRGEVLVMRLACIYALLDRSREIKLIHLQAALELWNYSFKSARYIYGETTILKNPNAIKLLEELKKRKEKGQSSMTRTEVSNEIFNRNVKSDELDSIFKELLSNGFVRVEKEKLPGEKREVQKITLVD